MPRGGARPGAGRKPGSATKRTREIADRAADAGLTPLDYMLGLLRDESLPPDMRFEAAKAAAPYVHPKLATTEHKGEIKTSTVAVVPPVAKSADEWAKQYASHLVQ
jgi:hypothetical protein